jgi:3-deoxy-D-manno-octulosonic-acid transferase
MFVVKTVTDNNLCCKQQQEDQQRGREMGFPDFLVKKSGNVHFFEHDAVRN